MDENQNQIKDPEKQYENVIFIISFMVSSFFTFFYPFLLPLPLFLIFNKLRNSGHFINTKNMYFWGTFIALISLFEAVWFCIEFQSHMKARVICLVVAVGLACFSAKTSYKHFKEWDTNTTLESPNFYTETTHFKEIDESDYDM